MNDIPFHNTLFIQEKEKKTGIGRRIVDYNSELILLKLWKLKFVVPRDNEPVTLDAPMKMECYKFHSTSKDYNVILITIHFVLD